MDTIHCERCGKVLDPGDAVMLELNCVTNLYTDPLIINVPVEESQGGFYFGKDCADAVLNNGGKLELIGKAKKMYSERRHW